MSKKVKGQKVDAGLFFSSSSTNVADVPALPTSDRSGRPGGRPVFEATPRAPENNEREMNWRRPGGPGSLPPAPPAFRPAHIGSETSSSSQGSGKWDNVFGRSNASASSGAWRPKAQSGAFEENPRSTTNNTEIKVADVTSAVGSISLQASKAESPSPNASASASVQAPKSSESQKPKVDNKKNATKSEAARKAKELKDATLARVAAEKKAIEESEVASAVVAKELVGAGLKGESLLNSIKAAANKPTGATLVSAILSSLDDPLSLSWCKGSEYGAALKFLLGNPKSQCRAILAIQGHCHKLSFPKITTKDGQRNFIEVAFQMCYKQDIIDAAGFLEWADDDSDSVGKITAIVQTTSFMQFLSEVDSEVDDEDDDLDAPMQTIS